MRIKYKYRTETLRSKVSKVECPRCGTEIETPVRTWRIGKSRVLMGTFECQQCRNRFKHGVEKEALSDEFIETHPTVKEWLEHRPQSTKRNYVSAIMRFCEFGGITPKEFQLMDRKQARDLAWNYVKTLRDRPSVANLTMSAIKSFYRNHDGEALPFDSNRGGKHYFNNLRRKKAAYEHVPTKKGVYEIADMASNLRDRAIILVLFQSGIRVNAICRLTYGMVRRQLQENKVPLRLRITDEIDTKLRSYKIDFYDTFLQKEAIEALKKYCELKHRNSSDDTPLFLSKTWKPMNPTLILGNFKKAARKSGLNKKTIWTHTIRKSFKRVVRHAPIDDDDFKEAIMGHVIPGSRENYFSRNNTEEVEAEYMKIDFSREGKGADLEPLEKGLVEQTLETRELKEQVKTAGQITDKLWETIDELKKDVEELKRKTESS